MGVHDFTVYSVIKRSALLHRDRTALISGDKTITYQEYLGLVDRIADGLLNDGMKKGDRIAVLALNSIEFLCLYGAAAKIGIVVLPINWRLKPEEMGDILSQAMPKMLFVDSEFQAIAASLIPRFDFIEKSYSIGSAQEGFAAFSKLLAKGPRFGEIDVHSDEPYVILPTAAVDGRSRGAVIPPEPFASRPSNRCPLGHYFGRLQSGDGAAFPRDGLGAMVNADLHRGNEYHTPEV